MNTIISKITVDLIRPGERPVIHAVQGERNVRQVQLTLLCEGNPWQIPEDAVVAVRYGRVDLSGGYYDTLPDGKWAWSCEENRVLITLAPQMMSQAGSVLSQVEILQAEQLLATFSFQLMVEANPSMAVSEPDTYINWLQWMKNQLAEHVQTVLENGEFTGPAGAPATVTDVIVGYQASVSGTVVPSGTWSSGIPDVAAGQFLWTKTTVIFNDTSPVTFYSVTRSGGDGSGAVSSVAGISPDEKGNVALTAEHLGALPSTGGTMDGPVNMNGQALRGLNAPNADDEAANMGFVNQQVRKAAPRNLLDNSDFRNPVNQRGQASYTSVSYGIDRWLTNMGAKMTVTVGSGKITLSKSTSGGTYEQVLPIDLTGKTVTYAIKTGNGITCQSAVVASSSTLMQIDGLKAYLRVYASNGTTVFGIYFNDGSTVNLDLYWAALYEGAYTEETLPEYQSKGFAAELAACQRYYCNSWFGLTDGKAAAMQYIGFPYSATMADCGPIVFPQTMRIFPTMQYYGSGGRVTPHVYTNAYHELGSLSSNFRQGLNGVYARVTKGAGDTSTWTVGSAIQFHAHWEASADL